MYPMSNVPEKYRFFEFLNPMSGILEYSRYVLIGLGGLTKAGYCYVLVVSLLVFCLGILVFKWKEAEMVEDL
jgi:lipopolysaccharide transport system permease protein